MTERERKRERERVSELERQRERGRKRESEREREESVLLSDRIQSVSTFVQVISSSRCVKKDHIMFFSYKVPKSENVLLSSL